MQREVSACVTFRGRLEDFLAPSFSEAQAHNSVVAGSRPVRPTW